MLLGQAQESLTTVDGAMTPQDLEARRTGHAGPPDSATVAAALHKLRDDPDWTITEITVNGRLVHVELVYEPTGTTYAMGVTYTLQPRAQQQAVSRAPDADTPTAPDE